MDRFLLGLFAVLLIVTAVLAAAFVLYYQPQTRELEDARQDASRLAQERADLAQQRAALNGRVSDLEHLLDEIRAESEELEAKVQAKEAILAELQSTQDELEQEIADGQIRVQRLRGQLRVDMVDEILFDSGEVTLKPEGRTVLKKVASVLANANRTIQDQGHTDNVPIQGRLAERFPTNWELSATRAVNVVRFLHEEAGLDPTTLSATGLSEYRPSESNDTDSGRQKNRRIEILLVPPYEPDPEEN